MLWVNEYQNELTISRAAYIVKTGVEIRRFKSIDELDYADIVLVSNKDKAACSQDYYPASRVIYEDVVEKFSQEVIQEYKHRYDYYYLSRQLEAACSNHDIRTLITESSYGLWDIDERLLDNTVNLSLGSQDMYYSLEIINRVISKNHNIKMIIILCAYYYFYSDLSREKNPTSLQKITNVYLPLLGDRHNAVFLPPRREFLSESEVFDGNKVLQLYCESKRASLYFNEQHPREKRWELFSDNEREDNAIERATSHNKNTKYIHSFIENRELFSDFSEFCQEKGIELSVVVVPTTYQYRKYLDNSFGDNFYNAVNDSKGIVHLYDCSDLDFLKQEDFFDADHLNENGAKKFTTFIKKEMLRD